MSYLPASHWLPASDLGGPLSCWDDYPVIVPSSEEGGLLGLRVCFAFCVRPVVTKGRFPLVTVYLALARTERAAQAQQAWGPCGAATLKRTPGVGGSPDCLPTAAALPCPRGEDPQTFLLAFPQGTCLEHSRTLDFVVGVGRL